MNIITAVRDDMLVPIHPAGWPFIGLFAAVTLVIGFFADGVFLIGVPATLWCVYFFRNPERITPVSPDLIIAPADGRIIATGIEEAPAELGLPAGKWRCICIFMNVFDVHVNRAPVAGKVIETAYHEGAFLNASLDKASEQNERQNMVMEIEGGQQIGVVQIAGLVARRIILEAAVGDHLNVGQQYGIIRFGSRVDVWLPAKTPVTVLAGQRTIAGETVIADLAGNYDEPVAGTVR